MGGKARSWLPAPLFLRLPNYLLYHLSYGPGSHCVQTIIITATVITFIIINHTIFNINIINYIIFNIKTIVDPVLEHFKQYKTKGKYSWGKYKKRDKNNQSDRQWF